MRRLTRVAWRTAFPTCFLAWESRHSSEGVHSTTQAARGSLGLLASFGAVGRRVTLPASCSQVCWGRPVCVLCGEHCHGNHRGPGQGEASSCSALTWAGAEWGGRGCGPRAACVTWVWMPDNPDTVPAGAGFCTAGVQVWGRSWRNVKSWFPCAEFICNLLTQQVASEIRRHAPHQLWGGINPMDSPLHATTVGWHLSWKVLFIFSKYGAMALRSTSVS